jgi:hypothetical protein
MTIQGPGKRSLPGGPVEAQPGVCCSGALAATRYLPRQVTERGKLLSPTSSWVRQVIRCGKVLPRQVLLYY